MFSVSVDVFCVDFIVGVLLLLGFYYLFLFIINIRELSWKHDASMSTLSHQ